MTYIYIYAYSHRIRPEAMALAEVRQTEYRWALSMLDASWRNGPTNAAQLVALHGATNCRLVSNKIQVHQRLPRVLQRTLLGLSIQILIISSSEATGLLTC